MSYRATLSPRSAPNTPSTLPDNIKAALASLEVPDCGCKLSMTPRCLIGEPPGCFSRRRDGTCDCKERLLPACQLDHPGGCEPRREGKSCGCKRIVMAECLSPGCRKRRRGKLCGCPRWPGEPCKHLLSHFTKMRIAAGFMTLARIAPPGCEPEAFWTWLLWEYHSHDPQHPDYYGEPDLPGEGLNLIDREERVAAMELRRASRVNLYHPKDLRYPSDGEFETPLIHQVRKFGLKIASGKGANRAR